MWRFLLATRAFFLVTARFYYPWQVASRSPVMPVSGSWFLHCLSARLRTHYLPETQVFSVYSIVERFFTRQYFLSSKGVHRVFYYVHTSVLHTS
jgi:hypothetical protein